MSVFYRRFGERQVGDLIVMFTDQMLPGKLPAGWSGDRQSCVAWRTETGDWLGADNHRKVWRDAMHPSAKITFAVFGDYELPPLLDDEE